MINILLGIFIVSASIFAITATVLLIKGEVRRKKE